VPRNATTRTRFDVHGSSVADDEAIGLRHRRQVEIRPFQLHLHSQHVLVELRDYKQALSFSADSYNQGLHPRIPKITGSRDPGHIFNTEIPGLSVQGFPG